MEITKSIPGGMSIGYGKVDDLGEKNIQLMATFSGSPMVKFEDGTIVLISWADIVMIADDFRKEKENGTTTN